MALEPPEDSALLSSAFSTTPSEYSAPLDEDQILGTTDDDSRDTETEEELPLGEPEESGEIDEALAEPEQETLPPAEREETLDWDDIASEIDLQMAAGETEAEEDETDERFPAELSFSQDETEKTADDFALREEVESEIEDKSGEDIWSEQEEDLSEIEVAEFIEESSLLDSADSLSSEEKFEEDLVEPGEITESYQESVPEDEAQLVVDDTDDIELEPYGIDKEQCWQCGKIDSTGGIFVSKGGRLYCSDCAPMEELDETGDTNQEQDAYATSHAQPLHDADTSSGDDSTEQHYDKISIRDALRTAWTKTKGAKGSIWAGSAIMYLVILIIVGGGAFLAPAMYHQSTDGAWLVGNILLPVFTKVFSVFFTAGLLLMGIRKVAGQSISWKMIFKGFSCAGKLIVLTFLQTLFVIVGYLFLILPGIYLTVGYAMTLPLIIDKGLSPWQAMETSRKAIHKVWWKVAGLFFAMGLIFIVSSIPLGIGIIWTWPMFIVLTGVVYKYLFGDEKRIA